ncbi:hypothetical protein J5N97_003354 [Dioscorea zingiberensis]|uniref:Uncharacterized protein n=1 Tax=Dioscorea zingiberensis TaxID=325984 RepID=A0A9D5D6H4_9LILI|nr:hypothetical protein J5N97_003354 [Dioscorea zingiberensis]
MSAADPPMSFQKQQQQLAHSGWHSPVPYLFGGLAAMLGLIAFALLILACSYWKLSGSLESREDGAGDERGEPKHGTKPPVPTTQYPEHHVVVIMAGEEKPTFLATPMSSRASSFGDRSSSSTTDESSNQSDQESKPEHIESHGHHHDEQHS